MHKKAQFELILKKIILKRYNMKIINDSQRLYDKGIVEEKAIKL